MAMSATMPAGAAAGPWATVSDAVLAGLELEASDARGLPNAAFTDPAFHELERTRLFPRTWTFAAPASRVPERGDVLPLEIAGRPAILVRGGDDAVRAFHNVCPHRGACLVTEALHRKTVLTCPYHAWSYDLEGSLVGRPHYHGPGKHQTRRSNEADPPKLFEIRSATWHDWVFVNLDGKAEPFESFIAPVLREFEGRDLSVFRRSDPAMRFEFESNWKLAVENYCDFYHVFSLHPALDIAMSDDMRRAMWPGGCHMFNGYGFESASSGIAPRDSGPGLPTQPGLASGLDDSMVYALVFPNFAVNVYPDSLQAVLFEPVGHDRTVMHVWFYYVGDAATATEFAAARSRLFDDWYSLNAEDEGICRQLQTGRTCDAYDGGRMAPYWDAGTLHYHRQIALSVRHEGRFAASTPTR